MQFYTYLAELEAAGTPFALATIVNASASSPGRTTFKMCITADGKSVGSIGGGALEFGVQKTALEMFRTGERSRLETYHLTDAAQGGIGMACGGDAQVFIEIIAPTPKLVILGGGHIGSSLTRFATEVGFDVTIIDDRPDFSTPEAHPMAKQTIHAAYSDIATIDFPQQAYFVIVTHQHSGDEICLKSLLKRPELSPKYIGLIGSAKKLARVFEQMIAEGYSRDALKSVHAPIGIDLGGQSAAEIALAIAAEIVAARYDKPIQDAMCVKKCII